MFGWIDNNIVLMISIIHIDHEELEYPQKKPRVTDKNKGHV